MLVAVAGCGPGVSNVGAAVVLLVLQCGPGCSFRYIYVPQLSESCCPSSLLEGGPVQPVHHCADIRSIVVAVNLDEACSPSLYGFDLVNAFLHNGPI